MLSERFRILCLLLAAALIVLLLGSAFAQQMKMVPSANAGESYEIALRSRTFTPAPGIPGDVKAGLKLQGEQNLQAGKRRIHTLIQLDHIPTPAERQQLRAEGINLLTYVPNYAWMASIPAENPEVALSRPSVRWVGTLQPDDKKSPALREENLGEWSYNLETDQIVVLVQLFKDVDLAEGRALVQANGGEILGEASLVNTLVVRLPRAALDLLAGEDIVEWIEQPIPSLTPVNAENRTIIGANTLQLAPYGLDGTGVDVLIYDGGRAYAHNDLATHMDYGDTAAISTHSTHVAGTVAGNGTVTYNNRGMAPAAYILSMGLQTDETGLFLYTNPGDIQNDFNYAKNTWGRSADLLNMSLGVNVAPNGFPCALEGNYGITDQLLDSISRGSLGEPFIMACAAGNERGGTCGSSYRTISPPAGAKNPIHSGATDESDGMSSFSGWGPTDDGRLKPTICAPGVNVLSCSNSATGYTTMQGTSMASPTTAGIIALMLQQYRITYSTTGESLPSSAKALLIHTALDLGNTGPDYQYGYGRIRGVQAVNEITNRNLRQQSMSLQGEFHEYTLTLPSGMSEFRVSMAWDDPAGSLAAIKKLVNDLDLVAIAPNGTTNYPWVLDPANPGTAATRGVDQLNNQEQVVVSSPAAGTWLIRVKASILPESPQWYSIVFPGAYSTTPSITPGSALTPSVGLSYEAVTNGTFETGTTPWTLSGSATRSSTYAHGGTYSMRLGGTTDGYFYQQVTIPADAAEALFSYWVRMTTSETSHPWDFLYVDIRDNAGNTLTTLNLVTDGDIRYKNTWAQDSFTLGREYAGKTLRLYFVGDVDSSISTYFYVDDVTLYTVPTCLTYPASSVTPTSAVLSASVNPRGSNTVFYFQYGTSTNYGSETIHTSAGSGTAYVSVSNTISGVDPSTTYHCRIVATNAARAVCGSNMTFVTTALT
ncbi:MAG: S8 family serine peptidase, partial [Verrucomicrobia bacterium]|nr:S8 family serine peptidase [Verrucomicrobiota bacterium]